MKSEKKTYYVEGVEIEARSRRTARRRARAFLRGEVDIDGRTIPVGERRKKR